MVIVTAANIEALPETKTMIQVSCLCVAPFSRYLDLFDRFYISPNFKTFWGANPFEFGHHISQEGSPCEYGSNEVLHVQIGQTVFELFKSLKIVTDKRTDG